MLKKYKMFISFITIFILLILFKVNIVNAATTGLTATKTNVTTGSSVTVTASVNAGAWNLSLSGAGQTKGLVGQTNTTDNISASTSITFTANTVGTYTITLKGDVTDYHTDIISPINKSININVTKPNTTPTTTPITPKTPVVTKKSSDAKLKALSVAQGKISPDFNYNLKEYTLEVPNEITEISVAATVNNSRATYNISGNKELKEGENLVYINVKAEDGTTNKYTIKVTREKAELTLTSLNIKYKNEDKKNIEIKPNPEFLGNIYEYTLEDLEYYINKLEIEVVSNRPEAIVSIVGNEELKEGKNNIVITLKIPAQQDKEEEIKTYTIIVNKLPEPIPPTLYEKSIEWISSNKMMVIIISLAVCVVLLITLSIYIIIDNCKYKKLVKELKDKKKNLKEDNNINKVEEKKETIENQDNKKEEKDEEMIN
jgi:uncharacterized membrane protein (DUF485 family)